MNNRQSIWVKKYHPFWVIKVMLVSLLFLSSGCSKQFKNPIEKRLQAVPPQTGFRMDGYWVWGGSAIKVDSVYHMFASRWKKTGKFPSGYIEHSEIVHATSKTLVGPYQFREVVIGERDSVFWDSNMAHNPTITKIGDEYVLFYIGSDFTTKGVGKYPYLRRIGYATAKNIEGLWKRSDNPIIDGESNNPAVLAEGGKIRMLFRDEELKVSLATAEHYLSPYTIRNNNVWPNNRIEDFFMFKMDDAYHFICEDNMGKISGHERWGVHLWSENGIKDWKTYKEVIAYNHDIQYTDGSILHCVRRERPQLVIEEGKIIGLLTAVYTGEHSWCQPVPISPSLKLNNKEQ